jgi:hypothetical protein
LMIRLTYWPNEKRINRCKMQKILLSSVFFDSFWITWKGINPALSRSLSSDELFLQPIVGWWMWHQLHESHGKQHILFGRWFSAARCHKFQRLRELNESTSSWRWS